MIPTTQEAEAEELLDPGGGGCSEPRSHYTPGWVTEQDSLSKKKKEKRKGKRNILRARDMRNKNENLSPQMIE